MLIKVLPLGLGMALGVFFVSQLQRAPNTKNLHTKTQKNRNRKKAMILLHRNLIKNELLEPCRSEVGKAQCLLDWNYTSLTPVCVPSSITIYILFKSHLLRSATGGHVSHLNKQYSA